MRLGRRIIELGAQTGENTPEMTSLSKLIESRDRLDFMGVGPVMAAVCVNAWSHPGKLRSETAVASMAGMNPIPAFSGNTVGHQLNRPGDRRLNRALHTVEPARMIRDEETRSMSRNAPPKARR